MPTTVLNLLAQQSLQKWHTVLRTIFRCIIQKRGHNDLACSAIRLNQFYHCQFYLSRCIYACHVNLVSYASTYWNAIGLLYQHIDISKFPKLSNALCLINNRSLLNQVKLICKVYFIRFLYIFTITIRFIYLFHITIRKQTIPSYGVVYGKILFLS